MMMRSVAIIAILFGALAALWAGLTLASQQGDGEAGQMKSVPIDIEVQSDPCGHDPFIFAGPNGTERSHNMKVQVQEGGANQIAISGPAPWVAVSGLTDPNGTNPAVHLSGSGTVAGFQNVSVKFDGNWYRTTQQLGGKYTFGANDELPAGNCPDHVAHPAVYDVTMKPTPTPSPIGTGAPPTQEVTATPTPPQATPTPTPFIPLLNGTCAFVTHDAFTHGEQWDLWKCTPRTNVPPFNRVDIRVYEDDYNRPPLFACQSSSEEVQGYYKTRLLTYNASPHYLDLWSADFPDKCVRDPVAGAGVSVYLQYFVFTEIRDVTFTNVAAAPSATPTPTRTPTPTPPEATATMPSEATVTPTSAHPRNGDANKDGVTNPIDATLVFQFSAGLLQTINPDTDVNGDHRTDAVDGELILQYSADLIHGLPVM